jgi:hypothetical protein
VIYSCHHGLTEYAAQRARLVDDGAYESQQCFRAPVLMHLLIARALANVTTRARAMQAEASETQNRF